MLGYAKAEEAQPFDQDQREPELLQACSDGAVVVAYPFGCPVAMRAAGRAHEGVHGLILLEPAAYVLADEDPAVIDHIRRVLPVLDRAADVTPLEFISDFQEVVTGGRHSTRHSGPGYPHRWSPAAGTQSTELSPAP